MESKEAKEIYMNLGVSGIERYSALQTRAEELILSGNCNNPTGSRELAEVNQQLYELRQEAGLISNR